jgi:hypothetical protein
MWMSPQDKSARRRTRKCECCNKSQREALALRIPVIIKQLFESLRQRRGCEASRNTWCNLWCQQAAVALFFLRSFFYYPSVCPFVCCQFFCSITALLLKFSVSRTFSLIRFPLYCSFYISAYVYFFNFLTWFLFVSFFVLSSSSICFFILTILSHHKFYSNLSLFFLHSFCMFLSPCHLFFVLCLASPFL